MRDNLIITYNTKDVKDIWIVEPEGGFETYFWVINYNKDVAFKANCQEDANWLCEILNKQ